MSYGGIDFGHVWAFQIRCMMANQYSDFVEAIGEANIDGVIVACLRLGWNDAFRHVSKNVDTTTTISEISKLTSDKDWKEIYDNITSRRQKFKGKTFEINDEEKKKIIIKICKSLVDDFKIYLEQQSTDDRINEISKFLAKDCFKDKFKPIKDINAPGYELCLLITYYITALSFDYFVLLFLQNRQIILNHKIFL